MADLNEGRLDLPRSPARFIAFGVAAALLFSVLGGRLFQLQVLNGAVYSQRAAAARTATVPIPAPRGLIFDRAGRAVAVNVPSWVVKVRPADLPDDERDSVLRRLARLIKVDRQTLERRYDAFLFVDEITDLVVGRSASSSVPSPRIPRRPTPACWPTCCPPRVH